MNGDVFESSDDYESHFQRLEEHLIHRTNERRKAARPTTDDDHEWHKKQWLSEAYDPLAKELGEFIERCERGNLMRRAEVPHIHAVEKVMRLSRNEMARARDAEIVLVNDTASAAVDVSAVTNESNIFYSNFCVDLTEKNARGKQ